MVRCGGWSPKASNPSKNTRRFLRLVRRVGRAITDRPR
jgi:hypothetical protein